ncbi:hypothetical protein ACFY12_07435 [Streptomyces sp. NPDC001339]|uniref:hypothetical protein n=1 Tax=Streptomyces sp. NPDC001339 TaxID=3364563 RepID=UPI0036C1BB22
MFGSRSRSLGFVVDEAAAWLLNLANPQRTTLPFDSDLLDLSEVDRLPLAEHRRLLETATRLAAPTVGPQLECSVP